MTNGDRIRSMTDEELAVFLYMAELGDIDYSKTFCDMCDQTAFDCDDCRLHWIKKETDWIITKEHMAQLTEKYKKE